MLETPFLHITAHMFCFSIATDKRGYPHNIFLISPRKHMLWYSLEAPQQGASNEYPQHMFAWRNKKNISIFWMKKMPYLLLWFQALVYWRHQGQLMNPSQQCHPWSLIVLIHYRVSQHQNNMGNNCGPLL